MPKPGVVVLLLAYLAFVSLGLPDTVLGVAWPSLRAGFGIPASAMGAVLAAGMSGYFLSGLWAGSGVAKLGVGGVLALSSALVAAALFAFALAPSWAVFFPFGAVMGLGSGAIDSGLNGYAARHFSVRHVNWLHGCWGVGASIGPALMTFFIARGDGYRSGYALLGAILGSMALLFTITRKRWDDPRPAPLSVEAGAHGAAAAAPPASAKPESARAALRNGRVWLQVLVFFLYTGVESTVGQWCFSWLRDRRGLEIEAAGSWTSAYWASLTVGRLVLGSVVDRVGPDRMLRAATVGAVLGVTLFASASGPLGSVGLLLLGASLAPLFPTLMARTPARVGDGVAHHAVGFQVSAATLGSTLVPSLVGFLVARHGLSAMGVVVVVAAVALLLAHELLLGAARRVGAVLSAP
jgi:fucose permease